MGIGGDARFGESCRSLRGRLAAPARDKNVPARVIMKTYHPFSESLKASEPVNGGEAEGNCFVARRGGKQPEAKEQSQRPLNSIRRMSVASLRATGEACAKREPEDRDRPESDDSGTDMRGWSENVLKEICVSGESCAERPCRGRRLPR